LWLKAIVLIPRKDGHWLLDKAIVFKRYGSFVEFKDRKWLRDRTPKAYRKGNGVGVLAIFGAPTKIDGDIGEFAVFFDWEHVKDLEKAFDESDALTAKLTNKRQWGGKRPYTSPWLQHHM
jgi:hypothetical protein